MLEALHVLLASLLEVLLTIAEPLLEFLFDILNLDQSLGQRSRLGESPLAKKSRQEWLACGRGCLASLLVLGLIVSVLAWLCQA